jgi:hypothetical protein
MVARIKSDDKEASAVVVAEALSTTDTAEEDEDEREHEPMWADDDWPAHFGSAQLGIP